MPATDQCEPQVINALQKEGWEVETRSYPLVAEDAIYYADLRLKSANNQRMIVVEVKCFPDSTTLVEALYRAVGQYLLYENILARNEPGATIYLSIPNHVYTQIRARESLLSLIKRAKIKLIVVSIETETVEQWLTL